MYIICEYQKNSRFIGWYTLIPDDVKAITRWKLIQFFLEFGLASEL